MNSQECIPGKEFLQCEDNSALYHYGEIIDEVASVTPGFMRQDLSASPPRTSLPLLQSSLPE